jgi:hypothetical protein
MEDIFIGNIHGHSRSVSPASLLGVSAGYFQKSLVAESELLDLG